MKQMYVLEEPKVYVIRNLTTNGLVAIFSTKEKAQEEVDMLCSLYEDYSHENLYIEERFIES